MNNRLDFVFEFLSELKKNNNRAWIHQRMNEKRFKVVKLTWIRMVQMLMLDISDFEPLDHLKPKDCIFRIWRDIRFSKDKTPCKTWMSAVIRFGGRNNDRRAAYYVQIGPGNNSFAGGGIYMPESDMLKELRRAIHKEGDGLHRIVSSKKFKKEFGGLEPLKLKTAPRDWRTVKMPANIRELIRHTSFVATREFTDKEILADSFETELIKTFHIVRPLNEWLNKALIRKQQV